MPLDVSLYPPGTLYGNHNPSTVSGRLTLAVAGPDASWRAVSGDEPEYGWLEDLPPGPPCGLIGGPHLGRWFGMLDPAAPSLRRMVTALTAAGVPVLVWDGTVVVPFAVWLARFGLSLETWREMTPCPTSPPTSARPTPPCTGPSTSPAASTV